MFDKNQYIFSETMGVCRVVNISKLSSKKQNSDELLYYHLRSAIDKTKDAYIPVENHKVALRNLITKDEACAVEEEAYAKLSDIQKEEVDFVKKNFERLEQIEKEIQRQKKKLAASENKASENTPPEQ